MRSPSGKRILVTGGRGFIGSALVRRLLDAGNEVVVLDLEGRPSPGFDGHVASHPRLELHVGDVLDARTVQAVARDVDLVFHLAAVAGVHNYHDRPVRTLAVNFVGTWNVLSALDRTAAPARAMRRLVHLSSSEVYGSEARDAAEGGPTSLGPVGELRWTYAAGKVAADHLAHAFHAEGRVEVVTLRPFNVYGPGQVGEGAVHSYVVRALLDADLPVTGDGAQTRSWCYLDDMVAATLAAAIVPDAAGCCFNVGNPYTVASVRELAELIRALTASSSRIVTTRHVGADVRHRSPDIARAREVLDFEPRVSLEVGLQRTIDWYRAQGRPALVAALDWLESGAPHSGAGGGVVVAEGVREPS